MSKKGEKASSEAPDEAAPASVYDFLYHDSRRIGSFLSQFDNNGLLTGISQGETAARGAKRGWRMGIGGEMPLLGGATLEVAREPGEGGSESFERSYDPFWTNALAFLDFLTERALVQPQIEEANLGQFVLVRGHLTVLDLAMFQKVWNLPTAQQAARAGAPQPLPTAEGNRHERRNQQRQGRQQEPPQMPSDVDLTLEFLTVLPHTVHASILTQHERVWSNLREEFLVTPSAELVLTHGATLPGQWAMLGIMSGRPDYGAIEHQQALAQIGSEFEPGLVNSGIGLLVQHMAPLIRQALGRPVGSYAVTPLLIFREVT